MNKFFYWAVLMIIATGQALAQAPPVKADTILTSPDGDTLLLKKKDYYTITTRYPELLYAEFPAHPDLLYASRDSGEDFLFDSDAGQDFYCMVYAFFLKQRNGAIRYVAPRKTLNSIFQNLNTLFSRLHCGGGTYYAHRENRVPAYAEHSVYWYILYETESGGKKAYNIAAQKKHYIALLQQIINDEMEVDNDVVDCSAGRKKELLALVKEIDRLITNPFYLQQALAFQYGAYNEW